MCAEACESCSLEDLPFQEDVDSVYSLADKELERELDIASKANAARAEINRQYEYIKK